MKIKLNIIAFLRIITIALVSIVLWIGAPAPALAADIRNGNNVVIDGGEVIDGDLYVAGNNITINGTVNGDIFAAGMTITLNGQVNGGITFAAQSVTITSDISNGARIAAQSVNFNGDVGRDLVVASNTLNVSSGAQIGADLVFTSNTVIINGTVARNIIGSGNEVTLGNVVGANVKLNVNSLTLTGTADVRGSLEYRSRNEASIQPGGTVQGTTVRTTPVPDARPFGDWLLAGGIFWAITRVAASVALFLIGLVIIFASRRGITALSEALRTSPLPSLGWGALILFGTPLAALIVFVTLVGIPLSIIVMMLYGILVYLSEIPVALLIGLLVLGKAGRLETGSYGLLIGALALGMFLLLILQFIPVAGWISSLFIVMFGLGTLITVWRRRRAVTMPVRSSV